MPLKHDLARLAAGDSFTRNEAAWLMEVMVSGEVDPVQVGAALMALRMRGASGIELAGFADCLRSMAVPVDLPKEGLVDTCGTGGGAPSFNLSTGAALLAASAGAKVAKHGNRSVTSHSGSADVLRELGIPIFESETQIQAGFEATGFAFLFAPYFHPGLKTVGPIRVALGVRTVFNQLGPLLNPAGAAKQIVGVFDPQLGPTMAEALSLLGAEEAWVVHGEDGIDEVSPCAPTRVWKSSSAQMTIQPTEFFPVPLAAGDLAPGPDAASSAARVWEGLTDPTSTAFQALLPGASVALHLSQNLSLSDSIESVAQACTEGKAKDLVNTLRSLSA